MTKITDADLLRDHIGGDSHAFSKLVARHSGWLFAAARRRLGDDHLADDARQAVLLMLAEKADLLADNGTASVSAWLFHVMHFTCSGIKRTRRRQSRREAVAGEVGRSRPESADVSVLAMLEDTVAQLPPRDREALVRRFYQRDSFADVGRALGITAEAARKRVRRVVAQCRVSMEAEGVKTDPESLLALKKTESADRPGRVAGDDQEIRSVARRMTLMVQQMEAIQFAVMTVELRVRDLEGNIDFFEKLGFRRHFLEQPAANGVSQRAAMRGGHARIWMMRATAEHPPVPGSITFYVWLNGGEQAIVRHRDAVIAQGVTPNQLFYDGALMNYTVTTPDGYTIGFFSTYQPHTFDLKTDG